MPRLGYSRSTSLGSSRSTGIPAERSTRSLSLSQPSSRRANQIAPTSSNTPSSCQTYRARQADSA